MHTVRGRLFAVVGILMIGFILLSVYSVVQFRSTLYAETDHRLQNLVDSAYTVLAGYQDKVAKGELSEADAKAQALTAIGAMRYDATNYFWIHDLHPTMIMHPITASLNGTDLTSYKSGDGTAIFVGMNQAIAAAGGNEAAYRLSVVEAGRRLAVAVSQAVFRQAVQAVGAMSSAPDFTSMISTPAPPA